MHVILEGAAQSRMGEMCMHRNKLYWVTPELMVVFRLGQKKIEAALGRLAL